METLEKSEDSPFAPRLKADAIVPNCLSNRNKFDIALALISGETEESGKEESKAATSNYGRGRLR